MREGREPSSLESHSGSGEELMRSSKEPVFWTTSASLLSLLVLVVSEGNAEVESDLFFQMAGRRLQQDTRLNGSQ